MIPLDIALQFGLPGAGAFVGTVLGWMFVCPNRRCCQIAKIRSVVENG